MTKLENRIATLKAAHRIVWIEGISQEIIKGKVAGQPCYFIRAESLNADGGHWYYIVRWDFVEWRCSCESVRPCKHEKALKAHYAVIVAKNRKIATFAQLRHKYDIRFANKVARQNDKTYQQALGEKLDEQYAGNPR